MAPSPQGSLTWSADGKLQPSCHAAARCEQQTEQPGTGVDWSGTSPPGDHPSPSLHPCRPARGTRPVGTEIGRARGAPLWDRRVGRFYRRGGWWVACSLGKGICPLWLGDGPFCLFVSSLARSEDTHGRCLRLWLSLLGALCFVRLTFGDVGGFNHLPAGWLVFTPTFPSRHVLAGLCGKSNAACCERWLQSVFCSCHQTLGIPSLYPSWLIPLRPILRKQATATGPKIYLRMVKH